MRRAPGRLAAGLCMAFGGAALAQSMNDPTRPPASVLTPGVEASRAAPVVQTVIITPHSRVAIIDGERVEVGGRYRDAQVVRISEDEVVLRLDGMTQVLRMYPDVEKKTVRGRDIPQKLAPRTKPP